MFNEDCKHLRVRNKKKIENTTKKNLYTFVTYLKVYLIIYLIYSLYKLKLFPIIYTDASETPWKRKRDSTTDSLRHCQNILKQMKTDAEDRNQQRVLNQKEVFEIQKA